MAYTDKTIFQIKACLLLLERGSLSAKGISHTFDNAKQHVDDADTHISHLTKALELACEMLDELHTPECERGWMDNKERFDYFINEAKESE